MTTTRTTDFASMPKRDWKLDGEHLPLDRGDERAMRRRTTPHLLRGAEVAHHAVVDLPRPA